MFSKHVSNQLSAYWHEELTPAESRRVAEHLIACLSCRIEFEEIKLGAKLAAQLPEVAAPDSLWTSIEAAFNRPRSDTPLNERRRFASLFMRPTLAVAAVASMILVAAFVILWSHHRSARLAGNRAAWEVARLDGAPRIGSTSISDKGKLAVGEWLETDGSSRAKIDVSSIGQVEIDPNTRVRLIETRPTEHRLELARGRLSARISAPPKIFFVNTPSAVAEDLGCAYTLEVDDRGNSLLHVTFGWVSLQLKDRESVVPAGAACVTRSGIGPGTPYFEDASEMFRVALAKLDFEPNDTQWSKIPALHILLNEARPRDAITLWYLLSHVDGNDRARVYDRMAELVPPPPGVTRDGVLRLDQRMLDLWKNTLEREWFERYQGK